MEPSFERLAEQDVQLIRSLRERKQRETCGLFWAEGRRTLEGLLAHGADIPWSVATPEMASQLSSGACAGLLCKTIDAQKIRRIRATKTFPGVGAIVRYPRRETLPRGTITVALNGVNDPGNMGTILRTGLWFGISDYLLDEGCADPYQEKAVRASAGAIAGVRITRVASLPPTLAQYRQAGYRIAAAVLDGSSRLPVRADKIVWVLGGEARGVSPEILGISDVLITIPGESGVESLNVAIAAGILFHETFNHSREKS